MNKRHQYWQSLNDYEKDIISIATREGGDTLRDLIKHIDPSDKVVADLGCGVGNFLSTLDGASEIYAVDWADNMLTQAKAQAPANTIYLKQDFRDLALPEQVDMALCFNALMPESHSEILPMLKNVLDCVKVGGHLIMVIPSFECRLYVANMKHHALIESDSEDFALQETMNDALDLFNNPLGYVNHSAKQQINKYWLEDEIKQNIKDCDPDTLIETFKVAVNWFDYMDDAPWQKRLQKPYFWGVHVKKTSRV